MKLATRINSILPTVNGDIIEALKKLSEISGITHVDLNYPEHFSQYSVGDVLETLKLANLKVNGLALRFRNHFINGELGNSNQSIAEDAYVLCKEAADACRELGGEVITLWLGFDGFDYPFQSDYQNAWKQVRDYVAALADYAPDLQISIEYKPYQERSYALIDSIGTTLLMVNEVNRENVGVTVDYCHMLMKRENPAYGLSLAADRGKLYGVHINDGYGTHDDGLMVGTVSFMQTLEFIYYLKKYDYQGVIYFDTFPVREEPIAEIRQNVKVIQKINDLVDSIGLESIQETIGKNDAVAVNELFYQCLK
ncbi:sugar phosphate isomerase/epimerase [Mesobacillus subterraneus]|jgi:xylose isomerase|uniref:sugar phosphate isomerase/epimerase family protein n=1 Tax=Mesobacillus subterraneus TaxID=285983 RepID=UPI0020413035|nr:sugar phosphate isomerase/epimerase family protein [Mesobacillus subterraneus]MCM3667282.1 sugar phosphate isomerase/epimerase [Mesobacillus subterraneus]MCM3686276.1 sugar phosphate isomerase/epimerase [Mesobacillus subterraneus]